MRRSFPPYLTQLVKPWERVPAKKDRGRLPASPTSVFAKGIWDVGLQVQQKLLKALPDPPLQLLSHHWLPSSKMQGRLCWTRLHFRRFKRTLPIL